MKIVMSSGHGKYIRGASGYLDEVDEARRVVDQTAIYLERVGVDTTTFHDNTSHDQDTNLRTIVNFHNSQGPHDWDFSVHFNAYQTTSKPMGTEVWHYSQEQMAANLSSAMSEAADFIDRGAKQSGSLYFLVHTNEKACLLEVCFVDSSADADLYDIAFDGVCRSIASAISGVTIPDEEQPPEEIEPPPSGGGEAPGQPAIGTVQGVENNDHLNIRASASSSATVIGQANNGDRLRIVGQSGNWLKLEFRETISVYGWASRDYIAITGTIPGPEVVWHLDITSTQFGGGGDEQQGAYGNYITGSTRGVALPYKWRDSPRPKITVEGPKGTVTTDVVDVGPWNTDDPEYVLGDARPLAEYQYTNHQTAQNGQVPTNDAGIDLTDPIAREVGISGKGTVSWRIADEVEVAAAAPPKRRKGKRA